MLNKTFSRLDTNAWIPNLNLQPICFWIVSEKKIINNIISSYLFLLATVLQRAQQSFRERQMLHLASTAKLKLPSNSYLNLSKQVIKTQTVIKALLRLLRCSLLLTMVFLFQVQITLVIQHQLHLPPVPLLGYSTRIP